VAFLAAFAPAPCSGTAARVEPDEPGFAAGPSSDLLAAPALCARGEHLIQDGGRAALLHAREIFRAVTKRYPEQGCGHAGLARALTATVQRGIDQDDALIERAVQEARAGVQADAQSPLSWAALALALLADLKTDEAAEASDRAVELGPESPQAWHAAAACRTAEGRLEAARAAAERALALRPDLPAAHHVLGNVLLLEGRLDDAMDSYLRALVLSPEHMPSRFQLGVALERAGRFEESTRIFGQVLERHPEDTGLAHLFMAHSLVLRNSPDAALTLLDRAIMTNRRGMGAGTVRYLQGVCLEMLQRRDEAAQAYTDVIERYPDATTGPSSSERLADEACLGLARLHFAQGRVDEAAAVMEKGASRPGAGPDLLLRLAGLFEDYGMPERAGPLLESACGGPVRSRTAGALLEGCIAWARAARRDGDEEALGRLSATLRAGTADLERLGDFVHDVAAMRALSIAGRGDESLAWLRRAIGRGYQQVEWIRDDPDMQALRQTRGFDETVRSAAGPTEAPRSK